MTRVRTLVPLVVVSVLLSSLTQAQEKGRRGARSIDPAGVARLVADSAGKARVSLHEATGAARFVRVSPGATLGPAMAKGRAAGAAPLAQSIEGQRSRSAQFFDRYGSIFGVASAATELRERRSSKDRRGGTHFVYEQVYAGLPVFGAELRSHFDPSGELVAVNGTFVPDLLLDPKPSRTAEDATGTALARVEKSLGRPGQLRASGANLLVYREGLAKGVPGANHLAWQVEVGDGETVREFVYVDAQSGKFIDQITGVYDGKLRRAYDSQGQPAPGPDYPASPFWQEGETFPTTSVEANNMIEASGEIYDLFSTAFGRDSFDDSGAIMDSIFNRGNGCPNASWNGLFISFCPGTTTDDITAHEWGHAYTQYTHNLIYQWQPGALNESYSDIWGETIDRLNGRGLDAPGGTRTAGSCSAFTPLPPVLTINSPAAIAGNYTAGSAQFGPPLTPAGLTGDVVLADDGVGDPGPPAAVAPGSSAVTASVMDGCTTPFVNGAAMVGKIAMVYRGTCGFAVKVKNAQLNGAIGVIVANHVLGGNTAPGMAGADPTITVPSLSVGNADAELIRAQLGGVVNATLRVGLGQPIDNSYSWLMGEESAAFGGAIRDMWNPTCYGNAGKVSDAQYTCSVGDGGGVHSNSGVPNHAFALLVDGGSYNGQTVGAIGITKAAHIYYRAQTLYQGPASDFAEHADALEQSCSDLVGENLADLMTGAPSGQSLTVADCANVGAAVAAVELRTPPVQCNFQPLLAPDPPTLCAPRERIEMLFGDSFERRHGHHGRGSSHGQHGDDHHHGSDWTVSHTALTPEFTPRDWEIVSDLPDDRWGRAFFASDPDIGTCAPGGDESGVQHLDSPSIRIPYHEKEPKLTFKHWVATEPDWDGGNLKISVNGGPWVLVQPADFVFNAYNTTLLSLADGNTNPIAGEPAFSGTDQGSVGGSWGRSMVNLAPYATPGSRIRLRFDLGNDGCGGRFGWYLDNVMVYTCEKPRKWGHH